MSEAVEQAAALREMAQHRGYKLLTSRRRKPGVGDFGRYGLTDGAGKPILGVGADGLTALPQDIEAFLRTGALDSWKASANATPARRKPALRRPDEAATDVGPPALPKTRTAKTRAVPQKAAKGDTRGNAPASARRPDRPMPGKTKIISSSPAPPKDAPAPAKLVLRKAKTGDADALAALLAPLSRDGRTADAVARDLAVTRKAGGGTLVADRDGVIGCVSWSVLPTLHRGPLGRIALVFVAEKERRQGLGRQLVDLACRALADAGCETIEAMSDIDIRNAHNFFRSLDFRQASYRFTRSAGGSGT